MANTGWDLALDMPVDSRLVIKKLPPTMQPASPYRWALARLHKDSGTMAIIDQFLDFRDAILEVDNIIHLEEEGHL